MFIPFSKPLPAWALEDPLLIRVAAVTPYAEDYLTTLEKANEHFESVYPLHTSFCHRSALDHPGLLHASEKIPAHDFLIGVIPSLGNAVAPHYTDKLWHTIFKTVRLRRPRFLLFELPCQATCWHSGTTPNSWFQLLHQLIHEGYAVEWRVLDAANYGGLAHCKRLFVFAFRPHTPLYDHLFQCDNDADKLAVWLSCNGFFAPSFPVELYFPARGKQEMLTLSQLAGAKPARAPLTYNSGVALNDTVFMASLVPQGDPVKIVAKCDIDPSALQSFVLVQPLITRMGERLYEFMENKYPRARL